MITSRMTQKRSNKMLLTKKLRSSERVQELRQANRTSVGKITHDKVLNAAKGEQKIPGSSEVASGDCSYAEGGRF